MDFEANFFCKYLGRNRLLRIYYVMKQYAWYWDTYPVLLFKSMKTKFPSPKTGYY
jgi:hypothetical protein